ncbi:hypothetical protein [Maledivibacter halophilus]|uniref:Uncharacterized protein n=1 Tax=Maledivibacter halophilus TaxID=36842 RepID=A0A1T5K6A9_9FIRM|nr:hypothetical protein [Maledivibacter halophilus]SKC59277.1 hypothetical protein SAMN02194393_01669 [Maledivibacter halophilus]
MYIRFYPNSNKVMTVSEQNLGGMLEVDVQMPQKPVDRYKSFSLCFTQKDGFFFEELDRKPTTEELLADAIALLEEMEVL